jgi:hypothetical protein
VLLVHGCGLSSEILMYRVTRISGRRLPDWLIMCLDRQGGVDPVGNSSDNGLQQQVNEAQLMEKLINARVGAISAVTPNLTATVSKDSVTSGATTGLANVLAQLDAEFVADDLAVLAFNRFRQLAETDRPRGIRVIGDLSALGDIATRLLLGKQAAQLIAQAQACLAALGSPAGAPAIASENVAAPGKQEKDELTNPDQPEGLPGPAAVVPALAGVAGQTITLVTQLLAGTYQYGGQVVTPSDIGGLDALVGQKLRGQPTAGALPILVDRFEPLPADAQILKDVQQLSVLGIALAAKLSDNPAADPAAAAKPDGLNYAQAVAAGIAAFLSAAMTAPASGGLPPIAQAIHGESLNQPGTVIVYARITAAGDDDSVGGQLWHDQWYHLTGVSAEYAFIKPGGEVLSTGVRTVLASAHSSMHHGLQDFDRHRVYPPQVPADKHGS